MNKHTSSQVNHEKKTRRVMITTTQDLCGLFHIDECFEWRQKPVCLCNMQCRRFEVEGIAYVTTPTGETLFVKRYRNKFHGHTELNEHVEDQVVADPALAGALKESHKLTLYIGYQPCHHSAGGRKLPGPHKKSCTETLIQWSNTVLKPNHVELRVRCFGLYRAHWTNTELFEEAADVSTFEPRANAARVGLTALADAGIDVDGMTPRDWLTILGVCDPKARRDITPELWERRFAYDRMVRAFIHDVH